MLKIDRNPQFWADVKVRLPGEEEESFRARFKVMPVSRYTQIDPAHPQSLRSFLDEALVAVKGVEDDKGDVTLTPAVRDVLFDNPVIRIALFTAYAASIQQAASGN